MTKYFYLEDNPNCTDKKLLKIDYYNLPFHSGINGSYNILPARVMNMTYAQYLRYARDVLGAELIGKNTKYVVPYFSYNEETAVFVKLLNKRLDYIMKIYNDPFDYKKEENGRITRTPIEFEEC